MALFPNWNGSASPSSYGCFPTCVPIWCSATTGRSFPAPTTTWSAAFADSRRSIGVSVVARTGTPICCAMGVVWPTRPGGSKIRPIESFWSSAPPCLTVPAGANYDGRPPSLRASNSRAFVFVTSANPSSFPSKNAGPLLLSRHLCPDGKKDSRCPRTGSRGSNGLARASLLVSKPGLGIRGRNGGAYCHDAYVCLRAQRAASLRQGATQLWSQYHLDGLTFAARDG